VDPQLERPDQQQRAQRQPHAVHRDFGTGIAGRVDEIEGVVGRAPPLGPGLRGGPPGLAVRRGLGGFDMAGPGYLRVPGQTAVHVFLHAGQVPDQALNVQAAQRQPPPVLLLQDAEHPVESVGRPAERLLRGDLRSSRFRTAGRAGPQRRGQDTVAQAIRQRRALLGGGHDDSSS